jgi:hypothetical protein
MPNITKLYNNLPVLFTEEAFFNATEAAKQWGKAPKDWLRTDTTQEYIEAIRRNLLIEQDQLVMIKAGSPENGGGTWLHPKLTIAFARWLNADFAVWCDTQIEEILKAKQSTLTQGQMLVQMALAYEAQERRLLALEAQGETIKAIEAKQKAIEMSCRDFAVMAYANLIGVSVDLTTAAKLGKRCAAVSRERNMPIGKVRDPRFGQVNTYIEDILQEVFTEFADL